MSVGFFLLTYKKLVPSFIYVKSLSDSWKFLTFAAMNRFSLIFISLLLFSAASFSRPAYQGTTLVQQPDGTFVTLCLIGDEYRSITTTSDGYTLTRNKDGFYVYASLDADGRLLPSTLIAHDEADRTFADVAFLQKVGKYVTPAMTEEASVSMRRNQVARAQVLSQRRASHYNYSKFRGLIILVEFNDCPFRYSDYADIMEKMVNSDDYYGESRTNISSIQCTGSMRDYFRDNSTGQFLPYFDIVGPVSINRSQYYPRPNGDNSQTNYVQLMTDAVNAANDIVNYKDYDVDEDGYVDMIYFIFSGLPSYIAGNNEHLLWPHQSDISYRRLRKDGVYIGRYACSTELFGNEGNSVLEGIGTMCHEFSHILGLPDLYDTNNANSEPCVNPGAWSIMAGGADGNYGRTPVNYSLYERYSLGFATPEVISDAGQFSMEAIHKGNTGFRLNTPVKKEFFLLENRQQIKWDSVLPGHGMLIFRVDSTNASAWYYNSVNDYPNHPYYELVRANGNPSINDFGEFPGKSSDPFPGTRRVTSISNESSPANLLTWSKLPNDFALRNITEKNRVISFEAYYVNILTEVSLPDSVVMGFATTLQLVPSLVPENAHASFTWSTDDESVVTVDNTGLATAIGVGTANIIIESDNGLSDTCHVTVKDFEKLANVAAFCSLDEGVSGQLLLDGAKVLFAHNDDLYIRDASGSMVICVPGLEVQRDDVLSGSVFGKLEFVNRVPRLSVVENYTNPGSVTVTPSDEPAVPRAVKASGRLSDDMLADLLVTKGVSLVLENKMVFVEMGDQRARMYNTFGLRNISTPKTSTLSGKYFDVTGILTTSIINDSICYVLSLTDSVVEVEKPEETIVGDVNGDGVVDVADISSVIGIMAGDVSDPVLVLNGDVNGDGVIDVADISTIISIMAGVVPDSVSPCPGAD